MSIKQRIDAQTDALSALLTYANDATSAGDTDIGEAIRTLVDGYGKGGGGIPGFDRMSTGEWLATSTGNQRQVSISHNLGINAKVFIIFNTSDITGRTSLFFGGMHFNYGNSNPSNMLVCAANNKTIAVGSASSAVNSTDNEIEFSTGTLYTNTICPVYKWIALA